jgi:hypothetical protein
MGTRVIRGRGILSADVAGGERVIVIDETFVSRILGGGDPLGREVLIDGPPNGPPPRARVVGVVEASHMNQLDSELRATMYAPFSQAMEGHYLNWGMDVVVRGSGAASQESGIRRAVREIFPDAVIFRVATMEDVVRLSTADRRFHLVVLALFGGLALLLATIGVGGTLLLSVRDRHQEFAVRMALGARPRRLWWDVQRGGLVLTALGAVAGVSAALAGAGVFASLVYGISVRDPVSLIAGPVLMLVASFLAAAIPAARAVRTNPIVALRE